MGGGMMMGGATRGGGGDGLMLLNMEAIQKELEIVDDQKARIRAAAEEIREEVAKQMVALAKKKLEEILTAEQIDRLKQIQLQMAGSRALADPEVQSKLGLTDEQKERLVKLRETYDEQRRAMFSGPRDEEQDRRAQFEKMRNEQIEAAMQVLTAEQKEKFEQMKGRKFEMPRPSGDFRSRGGDRRGGDRGGDNGAPRS